ncbi:MAG TPA: His/Gly/Thr/Pro-type tRNA ligase C-terminal domain-containing protein, partial [Acidimicrobiales bacterium]|nr:His/Gly/Thr/Pro-type tRNA ligase C-terminal domain-containing protein [Acidimicrobiales bacterium]
RREAEHVEGFNPELAVVTHGGGKKLEEPVVVRPTSETIINSYFSKWVQSYRDLPLLINQWSNVVRWELRPRLFLRSTEFLWQEGHTAHASAADAAAYARRIHLEVYDAFLTDVMACPTDLGIKPPSERFAGALNSMSAEGMMRDGKALQMATSHEMGQNFARAFDIYFQSESGESQLCFTASWGASTRLVGGLIMVHGDDRGLVVPPRLAPIQAVVLAVRDEPEVVAAAESIAESLAAAGVRAQVDRGRGGFGRRVTDWEIKGVPLRVEVGPRDLAAGVATLVRRDTSAKDPVALGDLPARAQSLLDDVQRDLFVAARDFRDANTHDVASIDEALEAAQAGFARLPWRLVEGEGEERLRADAVTVRVLQRADGSIPDHDGEDGLVAVVAKAY